MYMQNKDRPTSLFLLPMKLWLDWFNGFNRRRKGGMIYDFRFCIFAHDTTQYCMPYSCGKARVHFLSNDTTPNSPTPTERPTARAREITIAVLERSQENISDIALWCGRHTSKHEELNQSQKSAFAPRKTGVYIARNSCMHSRIASAAASAEQPYIPSVCAFLCVFCALGRASFHYHLRADATHPACVHPSTNRERRRTRSLVRSHAAHSQPRGQGWQIHHARSTEFRFDGGVSSSALSVSVPHRIAPTKIRDFIYVLHGAAVDRRPTNYSTIIMLTRIVKILVAVALSALFTMSLAKLTISVWPTLDGHDEVDEWLEQGGFGAYKAMFRTRGESTSTYK